MCGAYTHLYCLLFRYLLQVLQATRPGSTQRKGRQAAQAVHDSVLLHVKNSSRSDAAALLKSNQQRVVIQSGSARDTLHLTNKEQVLRMVRFLVVLWLGKTVKAPGISATHNTVHTILCKLCKLCKLCYTLLLCKEISAAHITVLQVQHHDAQCYTQYCAAGVAPKCPRQSLQDCLCPSQGPLHFLQIL